MQKIFTFSLNITTNILKVAQEIHTFVPTGAYAKICHKYLSFLLPIAMLKQYMHSIYSIKYVTVYENFRPQENQTIT